MPAGSLTTPDVIACSAEPIAADMVCEPASIPPAAPGGSENFAPMTTSDKPITLDTTARTQNLSPSPFQAVDEGRADPQADAIHEQVVEQALGETVQFELHAVN